MWDSEFEISDNRSTQFQSQNFDTIWCLFFFLDCKPKRKQTNSVWVIEGQIYNQSTQSAIDFWIHIKWEYSNWNEMGQEPAECIECMRLNQCSRCRAITNSDNHLPNWTKPLHRTASLSRLRIASTIHRPKCTNFMRNLLAINIIRKYSSQFFFFNAQIFSFGILKSKQLFAFNLCSVDFFFSNFYSSFE